MGKGIIKSGGDDGLYDIELTFHKDRVNDTIAIIDTQIATLTTKIGNMAEGNEKELEKLRRASYQKRKDYLNNNIPEDPTVSAWCGDLTEDLSGDIGTIEIPGERGIVQIQPGHEDNAVYNTERDGQLQPAIANTPAGTFYNLAMMPGWQKWKPTYRHGTISNIDTDNDTCDVQLYADKSSQQGLSINQESKLSGIPIEYMSCNSGAFEDGDSVLVKFEGQKQSGAKVIGFVDKPKQCKVERVYVKMSRGTTKRCFVWNAYKDTYAEIELNAGGLASFPCDPADISDWIADQANAGTDLFDSYNCGRNKIYTSCSWANWGTTSSSSDSHNEPSACACGLVDTATRECECDASIDCFGINSGYNKATINEHIAAYGDGWNLQSQNNSEITTNFRQEWIDAFYIEIHSCADIQCEDVDCLNWYEDTTEQITRKFHCPLEQNMFSNTNDKTTGFDCCADTNYATDTSAFIGKMRFGAQFSDDIIVQIYTVENNIYSGAWAGLSLEVRATAGTFPEGTDEVSPIGLSRNASFESAITSIFDSLLSEFPGQVILEANLSLAIYKG